MPVAAVADVLNAFRHQRKEHAGSVVSTARFCSVLNAFRHQRKEHTIVPYLLLARVCAQRLSASTEGTRPSCCRWPPPAGECSTPFGINGRNTDRVVVHLRSPLLVLNAFRHQRKEHGRIGEGMTRPLMCSTPFGINGRNTAALNAGALSGRSAQRLSASTEGTHHTTQAARVVRTCAQRLSASTEGTLPAPML